MRRGIDSNEYEFCLFIHYLILCLAVVLMMADRCWLDGGEGKGEGMQKECRRRWRKRWTEIFRVGWDGVEWGSAFDSDVTEIQIQIAITATQRPNTSTYMFTQLTRFIPPTHPLLPGNLIRNHSRRLCGGVYLNEYEYEYEYQFNGFDGFNERWQWSW